jgi:hypothetical protein
MKFAITGEHRSFFNKHQAIELEGLCTEEQLKTLNAATDVALAQKLNLKFRNLIDQIPATMFAIGRDLWRSNDVLKRFVTQTSFANVASEIMEQRVLRFGYSQLFPAISNGFDGEENAYSKFLSSNYTLEQASCIQGIQCGLMLCLSGENQESVIPITNFDVSGFPSNINVFSAKPGNGFFFTPQVTIDWKQLFSHLKQRYLLIVYTQATSVYVYKEFDPQGNQMKECGYCFGDKLLDKWNPIVHR